MRNNIQLGMLLIRNYGLMGLKSLEDKKLHIYGLIEDKKLHIIGRVDLFCLFVLILNVPVNNFSIMIVPWVCLQFVIVVFPDHTQLLFLQ